jgi:phytoene synthase
VFRPEIGHVVARLLKVAGTLYARADAGIVNLDPRFRPAIFAARHLYAEIGARVEEQGFDSISSRASVSPWRKAGLLALALRRASRAPQVSAAGAPLPETQFLVDAVPPATVSVRPDRSNGRRPANDFAWTIDLFTHLGRRAQIH